MDEVWISNSGGKILIKGIDCLTQSDRDVFEVIVPGSTLAFIIDLIQKVSSRFPAYPRSDSVSRKATAIRREGDQKNVYETGTNPTTFRLCSFSTLAPKRSDEK